MISYYQTQIVEYIIRDMRSNPEYYTYEHGSIKRKDKFQLTKYTNRDVVLRLNQGNTVKFGWWNSYKLNREFDRLAFNILTKD